MKKISTIFPCLAALLLSGCGGTPRPVPGPSTESTTQTTSSSSQTTTSEQTTSSSESTETTIAPIENYVATVMKATEEKPQGEVVNSFTFNVNNRDQVLGLIAECLPDNNEFMTYAWKEPLPSVLPLQDVTYTYTETKILYNITAKTNVAATIGSVTGSGEYAKGETATLEAHLTDLGKIDNTNWCGYYLSNWKCNGVNVGTYTDKTISVNVNNDEEYTAFFFSYYFAAYRSGTSGSERLTCGKLVSRYEVGDSDLVIRYEGFYPGHGLKLDYAFIRKGGSGISLDGYVFPEWDKSHSYHQNVEFRIPISMMSSGIEVYFVDA